MTSSARESLTGMGRPPGPLTFTSVALIVVTPVGGKPGTGPAVAVPVGSNTLYRPLFRYRVTEPGVVTDGASLTSLRSGRVTMTTDRTQRAAPSTMRPMARLRLGVGLGGPCGGTSTGGRYQAPMNPRRWDPRMHRCGLTGS